MALTLRSLGGLSTGEIARAFLSSESAMAQRIVRAKRKIAANNIPYEVPVVEQMPERLPAVLATLYLIFNEGYLAASGEELVRTELSGEAIRLARILVAMLPRQPEARGLLALMLLTDARRAARLDRDGELVLLEDQDRSLWDAERIAEGLELSREAAAGGPAGPYTVQARIAAVHAEAASAEETDWERIVRLYEWHGRGRPEPDRRAQPGGGVAMRDGPEAGLELIDAIEGLDDYQPLHGARADLLRPPRPRRRGGAAYERALALTPTRSSAASSSAASPPVPRTAPFIRISVLAEISPRSRPARARAGGLSLRVSAISSGEGIGTSRRTVTAITRGRDQDRADHVGEVVAGVERGQAGRRRRRACCRCAVRRASPARRGRSRRPPACWC